MFNTGNIISALICVSFFLVFTSCQKDDDMDITPVDDVTMSDIDTLTTPLGIQFVRTPDAQFENLPDWPYDYRYVEIDGLRQAYAETGPSNGEVVLLLHGQPSWSYLYRKMMPVLANAGYRVIAMDHLGMGRSDKPISIDDYTYLGHNDRLEQFIQLLNLQDINLFVQDWGSLIGLRVAGLNPDWFATIAVGNGMLPVIPAGIEVFPPVENPNETVDIPSIVAGIPEQQISFYDGCDLIVSSDYSFEDWMTYAMKAASFNAAEILEATTWFDLPDDVEAAYNAPFPNRAYMAGIRKFPSIINDVPGETETAYAGLTTYSKPFLTIWGGNDPGNLGSCELQRSFIDNVPGAEGKPHARLEEASHFLQDDQGEEIARRLIEFYNGNYEGGNFDYDIGNEDNTQIGFLFNQRYCEVLLAQIAPPTGISLQAYNTIGCNTCPEEEWNALNPEDIQQAYNSPFARLNGPRYWVLDSISSGTTSANCDHTFGGIEMSLVATIPITLDDLSIEIAYQVNSVERNTVWHYYEGKRVYILEDPTGRCFIMQSYSQKVDNNLQLEELETLGNRLNLPAGWSYKTVILEEDFALETPNGFAELVSDELENAYQLLHDGCL